MSHGTVIQGVGIVPAFTGCLPDDTDFGAVSSYAGSTLVARLTMAGPLRDLGHLCTSPDDVHESEVVVHALDKCWHLPQWQLDAELTKLTAFINGRRRRGARRFVVVTACWQYATRRLDTARLGEVRCVYDVLTVTLDSDYFSAYMAACAAAEALPVAANSRDALRRLTRHSDALAALHAIKNAYTKQFAARASSRFESLRVLYGDAGALPSLPAGGVQKAQSAGMHVSPLSPLFETTAAAPPPSPFAKAAPPQRTSVKTVSQADSHTNDGLDLYLAPILARHYGRCTVTKTHDATVKK